MSYTKAPARRRPRRLRKKLAQREGIKRFRDWRERQWVEKVAKATANLNAIIQDKTLSNMFHEVLYPELRFSGEEPSSTV